MLEHPKWMNISDKAKRDNFPHSSSSECFETLGAGKVEKMNLQKN